MLASLIVLKANFSLKNGVYFLRILWILEATELHLKLVYAKRIVTCVKFGSFNSARRFSLLALGLKSLFFISWIFCLIKFLGYEFLINIFSKLPKASVSALSVVVQLFALCTSPEISPILYALGATANLKLVKLSDEVGFLY